MKKQLISIISGCYNEEKNIVPLYTRIVKVFEKIPYEFELILVDNASTDNSLAEYERLSKKDKRVKILLMSRNFGSPQPSFIAGFKHMKGEAAVLLDSDIQDPPELIPKFLAKWKKGFKVVYGVKEKRKGAGIIMGFSYKAFYYLLNKMSYIKLPINAGEFSLMDKVVINEMLQLGEFEYYVRCLRAYVGYEQAGINYVRDARVMGKSDTNFLKNLWWAKTIIINFSFKPLSYISQVAFFVMLLTCIMIVVDVILYFINRDAPRGIPTIVILILFLGGVQLLSLSVIAEYLARIYMEIKHRPRYIIKRALNISKIQQDH